MRKLIKKGFRAGTALLLPVLLAAALLAGCDLLNGKDDDPPAAPGVPTVTAGNAELTVSWTAVNDATGYEVYYGTTNASGSATKSGGDVTGTTTTITSLTNGTTYYVWVKAKNDAGTSGFSPVASGTPIAPVTPPAAPLAPTVVPADSQLTVSWTAVSGATAYEVYSGTAADSASATKFGDDVTETTATITSLTNGTTYNVWVKAKNANGTSDFSPSASGTPVAPTEPPAAPLAPTVVPADSQLTVSWTAVSGATAYEVYSGIAADSASATKFGGDVTGMTATITSLTNGTTYNVWVKAKNANGKSGFSPSASGTPVAPTEPPAAPDVPTVTAGPGLGQLTATWPAVDGATAYEVYYNIHGSDEHVKFGEDITGTSVTITGLANGTKYWVWLKAKNAAGTSGFSVMGGRSGTTLAVLPAPTGLTATSYGTMVSLTWDSVEGATEYEVYSYLYDIPSMAIIGRDDITGTSLNFSYLTNGEVYYFWVKSKDADGTSDFSQVAIGTPEQVPLGNLQKEWLNAQYGSLIRIGTHEANVYEDWYNAVGVLGDKFPGTVGLEEGISYNGYIVDVTDTTKETGYIYLLLRTLNDQSPSTAGEFYAVHWKNFTGSTISMSGAYKADGKGSMPTLEQAKAEFTVENGYYATYTNFALAVPAAPVNLTVKTYGPALELTWDPVEGATGYRVYTRTSSSTPNSSVGTNTNSPGTTYMWTGLNPNKTYYAWVRAVNDAGRGPWAGTEAITAMPANLMGYHQTPISYSKGLSGNEWVFIDGGFAINNVGGFTYYSTSGTVGYAGTIEAVIPETETSGRIFIKITETGEWGPTEGSYYAAAYKNLSDTGVYESGAWKSDSSYNSGTATLQEAISEYAYADGSGYFEKDGNYLHKTMLPGSLYGLQGKWYYEDMDMYVAVRGNTFLYFTDGFEYDGVYAPGDDGDDMLNIAGEIVDYIDNDYNGTGIMYIKTVESDDYTGYQKDKYEAIAWKNLGGDKISFFFNQKNHGSLEEAKTAFDELSDFDDNGFYDFEKE
jgi:hypothetical protein